MNYQVHIRRSAQKALAALQQRDYERVRDGIRELGHDPRPTGCRKLAGRAGWRLRIGNYRVIYDVDDDARAVLVLHVGHRRDVYG